MSVKTKRLTYIYVLIFLSMIIAHYFFAPFAMRRRSFATDYNTSIMSLRSGNQKARKSSGGSIVVDNNRRNKKPRQAKLEKYISVSWGSKVRYKITIPSIPVVVLPARTVHPPLNYLVTFLFPLGARID